MRETVDHRHRAKLPENPAIIINTADSFTEKSPHESSYFKVVLSDATENGGAPCECFRVYCLVQAKPRNRNKSLLRIY
jgi:hypothetical protein